MRNPDIRQSMENPNVLLQYLETEHGLHFKTRPDGSFSAGPKDRMTDDLQTIIRERKADLIDALHRRADSHTAEQRPPADGNAATTQGQLALHQASAVEGCIIRLSVVAEQLRTLAESITVIQTKTGTRMTIEQLVDYIGTINRTSDKGYLVVCPIHERLCAWARANADGEFHFECEAGCTEAAIVAASPLLRVLSALDDIGEQSAALSEALSLTRNLLADLRHDLHDVDPGENEP